MVIRDFGIKIQDIKKKIEDINSELSEIHRDLQDRDIGQDYFESLVAGRKKHQAERELLITELNSLEKEFQICKTQVHSFFQKDTQVPIDVVSIVNSYL